MNIHPIFEDILKSVSGTNIQSTEQPPCDNDHVAEGCEKFDTSERRALQAIVNMCDAPHFDSNRRWKIRDVAAKAIK